MKKSFSLIIITVMLFLFSSTTWAATNEVTSKISPASFAALQRIFFLYIIGVFIASSIILFKMGDNQKTLQSKNNKYSLCYLMLVAFFLRLLIAPILEGHNIDISCFKAWASIASNDFFGFYKSSTFVDYPPLYIYVLFFVEKIRLLFAQTQPAWFYITMIKLPSLIADVVCGYIIYQFGTKHRSSQKALIFSAIYLFNPVTILDSAIWGQVDGFFTMLLLIAVIFMYENNYLRSAVFYSLAILMKPQGIIFLPVLFFVVVKKKDLDLFLKTLAVGVLSFIIPILPLSYKQEPLWILKLYLNTASGYKGASINAYNLFALLGANWKDDTQMLLFLSYTTWGFIFIVLVTSFVGMIIIKGKQNYTSILASIAIITGVFVLSSKMHERYLFPVMALLTLACLIHDSKILKYLLAGFTLTNLINILQVFLLSLKKIYWVPAKDELLIFTSLLNVILFGITFYTCYKLCIHLETKVIPKIYTKNRKR